MNEVVTLLRQVVEGVEALRADLRAFGSAVRRDEASAKKLLISYREAARRLGVSRGRTLGDLIANGELHPVDVAGRKRLEAAEVEQLSRARVTPRRARNAKRPRASKLPTAVPASEWRLKVR